jgi:hypothetical protein
MIAFRRRRFGRTGVTVEGMDREDLIIEAFHRIPELEDTIPLDWQHDDATCRLAARQIHRNHFQSWPSSTRAVGSRRLLKLVTV